MNNRHRFVGWLVAVLALGTASAACMAPGLRPADSTPPPVAYVTQTPPPIPSPLPASSTPDLPPLGPATEPPGEEPPSQEPPGEEPTTPPTAAVPATQPPNTTQPPTTACTNRAAFVSDVSIPDGTALRPNAPFTKTWRLRNAGSCTWTNAYSLAFSSGSIMGGPSSQPLPGTVAPGTTVDISVNLIAPPESGRYRAEWLLRSPDGALFGLGTSGDRPFWVEVVVQPAPTATVPASATRVPTATPTVVIAEWRGEYFRSRDLSGTPALVRNDSRIDFDWGGQSPHASLPVDGFGARWTRTLNFDPGLYRFRTNADDGIRVWVDDQRIINDWKDGITRENSAVIAIPRGQHTVRVEYYENTGAASARLTWQRLTETAFSDWKGEYWNNRRFDGEPVFARNDANIDFDWQQGPVAAGMPADNFAVRWTRTQEFSAGTYRFTARVDDGVRIWVDDRRIIDDWRDASLREVTADVNLTQGRHTIRVDYYERSGEARIRVGWQRVGTPTPVTPTPTLTATPTLTPTLTPTATATIPPGDAAISGVVWHDLCARTGQPVPESGETPAGCVGADDGTLVADGLRGPDEPGIGGIVVALSPGSCSAAPILTAVTASNGAYAFGGLSAGTYCVSISLTNPQNAAALLPGLWTAPNSSASAVVNLAQSAQATGISFGWDYLHLPLPVENAE